MQKIILAESRRFDYGVHTHYQVSLASSLSEIVEAQQFRFRIFAEEMGAKVPGAEQGLDADRFDDFCSHLLVRCNGQLVGYTRVLTCGQARLAGGFYSETEFDLRNILDQRGRFMEIGRTCIHPDHRNGTTISLLWSGLARFMSDNEIDYLMGCASLPVEGNGETTSAAVSRLREKHFSPTTLRVFPKTCLPRPSSSNVAASALPPLLKGYLRVGAKICGDPHWDKEFGVADLFILLNRADLDNRYARHFVDRGRKAA